VINKGDRVRVKSSVGRNHDGKTGIVVDVLDLSPPVIRVRLDDPGEAKRIEVDGTAEKFELLE
jgi:hypothetical protein